MMKNFLHDVADTRLVLKTFIEQTFPCFRLLNSRIDLSRWSQANRYGAVVVRCRIEWNPVERTPV